ncbi:MAG: hypothetical protein IPG50_11780 [Myxococcales bacterium]|nr:hypothetical protein [Myxococcales bacterium]
MALVRCAVCRRHVFQHEPVCPFCASNLGPRADLAPPDPDPSGMPLEPVSRRRRYAAALVASACALGSTAACAPSQPAESPNQEALPIATASAAPRHETSGPPPHGNSSMTFGGPPDDERSRTVTPVATTTATTSVHQPPPPPPPPDERWRRRGGQCVTQGNRVICPPYGCVFPDEACDVLRA